MRNAFLATLALLSAALAAPAAADPGSRYLTLDHWAYEGIRVLQEAGHLESLNPLLQPYRRDEVARAVGALDAAAMPPGLAHWARLLQAEFATPDSAATWGVWAEGGAHGSTGGRLDPLRPIQVPGSTLATNEVAGDDGDPGDVWAFGRAAGWVCAGPAVADIGILADGFLDQDPDGMDPQRRVARTENAYVSVTLPFGEVMAGRLARNWSLVGTRSVIVSDAATPYAQVGLTLRAGRFSLTSFLGELDTLNPADSVAAHKRYVTAHRVDFAWPDLVLSFRESMLYASERSGFSLRHLNPVEILYLDTDAAPADEVQNLLLGASVWWRHGPLELLGEGMLDDVDLGLDEDGTQEPTSYAFTLGGRYRLAGGPVLGLEYQQVSAWAYRTPNEVDRYSFLGRGLGENYSDFDRLSLWADLLWPFPGLRLTPAVDVLRQGEGDFRDPITSYTDYLASPNLHLGVTENTVRLGLRGRYQPERFFWVGWDVGANIVRSDLADGDEESFEAVAEAGARFDLLPRR